MGEITKSVLFSGTKPPNFEIMPYHEIAKYSE
jgi:hypothetical protein